MNHPCETFLLEPLHLQVLTLNLFGLSASALYWKDERQRYFSFSQRRSDKIKSMASEASVKVSTAEITIDQTLLFQRLYVCCSIPIRYWYWRSNEIRIANFISGVTLIGAIKIQRMTSWQLEAHSIKIQLKVFSLFMHSQDMIALHVYLTLAFVFKKCLSDLSFMEDGLEFSSEGRTQTEIEEIGSRLIVTIFGGKRNETLSSWRHKMLIGRVGSAKSFVNAERLPPKQSTTKYHNQRSYYQIYVYGNVLRVL